MRCLDSAAVDRAERFVLLSGRLIDRHRFAHLFRGASAEPVLAALRPYQNADGGFGNALEPDLRGNGSQPQPVEVALRLLDEVDAFGDPMVTRALDWLVTVTTAEGGVPFVLPSVRDTPRAPWWDTDDDPPASVNPTGAIAGLLHKRGVDHPWLAPATELCWRRLDAMDQVGGYDARCALLFLDHVPEAARADAALRRLGALMSEQGVVALDPSAAGGEGAGEAFSPLGLAPDPGGRARALFDPAVVDAHLDALVDGQDEDGGWHVTWPSWSPATGPEWRAWATVANVALLRAHGRLV